MTFQKGHIPLHKGKKRPGIGGVKKGQIPWNKGKKLSAIHVANLVKAHKGIKMPPFSVVHRKNMALARKGKKSHLWKGGISKENNLLRRTLGYRLWRESVFARDNHTCIWCQQRGGTLNADHIKPFALFPELRFATDNGRTLCVPCHKTTESYLNNNIIHEYR